MAERTQKLPGDLQNGIDTATPDRRRFGNWRRMTGRSLSFWGRASSARPRLVDDIARHFPLAGNSAAAIRRVKDPQSLAADCAELGIPHPAFRLGSAARPGELGGQDRGRRRRLACQARRTAKRRHRAAISSASFPAAASRRCSSATAAARASSASAGNGRRPRRDAPYRYGGAVRLRRIDRQDAAAIGGWLSGLTRRAGLVGLCSADFIRNADGYQLVEINPRPGATLDIFDSAEAPLMEAHLRAASGEALRIAALRRFDGVDDHLCVRAGRAFSRASPGPTGRPTVSRPAQALIAGDPVCTVFARGPSADATRRIVEAQARQLQRCWEGERT